VRNGLVPTELIDLEAWGSDTVAAVKDQVCRYLGLDPSAAFLAYQGYQLDDQSRLQDIPLDDGAELLVITRGIVG
jgi:hypothetical protein